MTKEDIITYVMNTPYNSNPAVLRAMLDQVESGGSDQDDQGGEGEDEGGNTGGVEIIEVVLAERPASVYGEYDLVFRIEKTYSEVLSILENGKIPVLHTPAVEGSYDWRSDGYVFISHFNIEETPAYYNIHAGPLTFFAQYENDYLDAYI